MMYDFEEVVSVRYDEIISKCNDEELKEVLEKCKDVYCYFKQNYDGSPSSEKAHYHLHFAQEAISEYIFDKSEC